MEDNKGAKYAEESGVSPSLPPPQKEDRGGGGGRCGWWTGNFWLQVCVFAILMQLMTVGVISGITYVIVKHHKETVVTNGILVQQGDESGTFFLRLSSPLPSSEREAFSTHPSHTPPFPLQALLLPLPPPLAAYVLI